MFAPYPDLVGPPEDSPALADIDTAMDLASSSVGEWTQAYRPAIDRLMRIDPARRRSDQQFMASWPTTRAMIAEHFPLDG